MRLELTFSADSSYLQVVRPMVHSVCAMRTHDAAEIHWMELAADEAVMNTIQHAYGNRPGNQVEVVCLLEGNRLEIRVSDRGKRFDLAAQIERDDPEWWKRPSGRGLGLHLIRRVSDDVAYLSEGARNTLVMRRILRGTAPTSPPDLRPRPVRTGTLPADGDDAPRDTEFQLAQSEDPDGGPLFLRLVGAVDAGSVPAFADRVQRACAATCRNVVIDAREVRSIVPAAWALLVKSAVRLRAQDRWIAVAGAPQRILEEMRAATFSHLIRRFPDLQAAQARIRDDPVRIPPRREPAAVGGAA